MKVCVEVWDSVSDVLLIGRNVGVIRKGQKGLIAHYVMDHDDATQRRALGEQCRNAFEAGQCVITYPEGEPA